MTNYPTLKDVSAEAGVSMALASVVLNGKKSRIKASPETRKKIIDAAEKIGYEPNRNARALRMSRSFLIGVITYDISSSFIPQILTGIEQGFIHTNYSVLPTSYHSQEEFAESLETFRKRKVDGLIIITTGFSGFPENLTMWNRIPKVFIGCNPQLDCTSSVRADGFAVGKIAAEAFLKRGCRKFVYLTYSPTHKASSGNYSGWQATLKNAGIAEENMIIVKTTLELEKSHETIKETLLHNPDLDCVFADSDIMAAAVLKAAQELGRKVPDDLQVIGVDDSIICRITTPPLTSIWQPKTGQGEAAAKLMLNLINENKTEALVLPVHLNARESIKTSGEIEQ
ncbi:MAG: LacI family DNA-binding transcriptional regulator [Lentisphaeria bacterium]|nr:LacI family DNA-binding transcriptional regulator [Lentisphaeria bacterium]